MQDRNLQDIEGGRLKLPAKLSKGRARRRKLTGNYIEALVHEEHERPVQLKKWFKFVWSQQFHLQSTFLRLLPRERLRITSPTMHLRSDFAAIGPSDFFDVIT